MSAVAILCLVFMEYPMYMSLHVTMTRSIICVQTLFHRVDLLCTLYMYFQSLGCSCRLARSASTGTCADLESYCQDEEKGFALWRAVYKLEKTAPGIAPICHESRLKQKPCPMLILQLFISAFSLGQSGFDRRLLHPDCGGPRAWL